MSNNNLQILSEDNILSKSATITAIQNIENEIKEGSISALNAYVFGKAVENFGKTLTGSKIIKEAAEKETELYSAKETITVLGAKVTPKNEAAEYIYSGSAITEIEKEVKFWTEKLKAVKEIAKNTEITVDWVHPETGEVLKINKAIKKDGDRTISVTLKS